MTETPTADFLDDLVRVFYPDLAALGRFERVHDNEVPQPFYDLLIHQHHMTVTLERFHSALVDVHVLDRRDEGATYTRKILLSRQSDQATVLFGLVRMHMNLIEPSAAEQIRGEQIPLGRILIEHNILRRVHLHWAWRIEPSPELAGHLNLAPGAVAWGRTAVLWLNGASAIELIEIIPGSV